VVDLGIMSIFACHVHWGDSMSEAIAKAQKTCRGYGCKCSVIMDEW